MSKLVIGDKYIKNYENYKDVYTITYLSKEIVIYTDSKGKESSSYIHMFHKYYEKVEPEPKLTELVAFRSIYDHSILFVTSAVGLSEDYEELDYIVTNGKIYLKE